MNNTVSNDKLDMYCCPTLLDLLFYEQYVSSAN